MNLFETIEKANYLADDDTVAKLATQHVQAVTDILQTHSTYFRVLLASTQAAICGKPTLRARSGKIPPLTEEESRAHLDAFEATHARLYEIILRVSVTPDMQDRPNLTTDEANRRAVARNRRTNYARTAATTLRNFIRRGGNVLRLPAPSATKSAVAGMTPEAEPGEAKPEQRDRVRIERAADRILATADAMATENKEAAVLALQLALAKIATALSKIGPKFTTKPAVAQEEHRPLKTPNGVFWPAPMTAQ